jgi:transcriptional regulator with XRE-family HTH domain
MRQRMIYRDALGLTQEEAAMLLKIPKSLLGMYEIGQRPLSSSIELQLITLYNLVQQQEPNISSSDKKAKDIQEHVLELNKELLKIQFQQLVLERKLAIFQSKFLKSEKLLKFVHVLETEVKKEERPSHDYINVLKVKAEKECIKYGTLAQTKLELKIRGIKWYQKALEEEVKKYLSSTISDLEPLYPKNLMN